jgi:hypothetical protein
MEFRRLNFIHKTSFVVVLSFIFSIFNIYQIEAAVNNIWKEFRSECGNCSVAFPTSPKHMQEQFELPKTKAKVTYDAYISSNQPQTMFMMLIAKYPVAISSEYQRVSLDGFINGLIQQGGKVVYINLLNIPNATGVEFFIQNGNIYFKGKVIMKEDRLYLIAMESIDSQYKDNAYHKFVESFKFTNK